MPEARPTRPAARLALVGPWLANKGDALMYRSVLERFADHAIAAPRELWAAGVPDELVPVILPPTAPELGAAARAGALQLAATLAAKGALMAASEGAAARLAGTGSAAGVRALLDCSGFGYGDAWSPERMLRREAHYRRLRRRGARIVFLPQALGPFERTEVADAARRLFAQADLIYARDADSLAHLRGLGLPSDAPLRRCPDISHALRGAPPADAASWARRVAIVPNARMIDRTSHERAGAYLDFLVAAAAAARAEDGEPWIVLHEENDAALVAELNARLPAPLSVIDEGAVATKGILGACRAVVASRYHALVSSLSQAVPVIGTSWSHKYDRLFEEYGHGAWLLRPERDAGALPARLAEAVGWAPGGEAARDAVVRRLAASADGARAAVAAMWAEVDGTLHEAGAID